MKLTGRSAAGSEITYEENFWTGKRKLYVDGTEIAKADRKTFVKEEEDAKHYYCIRGNFISGVTVMADAEEIVLCKNPWYEWILIFFPLVGIVFGVGFGGAIGGGLSALFCMIGAVCNAILLRSNLSKPLSVILCIVVGVVVNAAWIGIWLPIMLAISQHI